MTTTGIPEQLEASASFDLSEKYVVCPPRKSVMGSIETTQSDQDTGSLRVLSPDFLGPVVPVHSISPIPKTALSPYRFELLQQWEGTVTAVGKGGFQAWLADLTDPSRPNEEAGFNIRDVSDGDLPLVAEGAVFRWSIGYKTRSGQKERISNISFVRLPAWSGKTADAVKQATGELEDAFPPPTSPS